MMKRNAKIILAIAGFMLIAVVINLCTDVTDINYIVFVPTLFCLDMLFRKSASNYQRLAIATLIGLAYHPIACLSRWELFLSKELWSLAGAVLTAVGVFAYTRISSRDKEKKVR